MTDTPEVDPTLRAFAFSAGGFDAIMQLGVAHALLVTRAKAPDYVVGVSAGAVNATILAEVLQAGASEADARGRLAVKVDRLREFINAYREIHRSLTDAILPDSLEISANAPLKPLESPLHFKEEREGRKAANEAKAGLIEMINGIFGIRIPVSTIAVVIRRILGIIEAGEKPTWAQRVWTQLSSEGGLVRVIWYRCGSFASLFASLLWAALWSDRIAPLRRWRASHNTAGTLLSRFHYLRMLTIGAGHLLKMAVMLPIMAALTAFWLLIWAPLVVPLLRARTSRAIAGKKSATSLWDRILGYYRLRDGIANTDVLKAEFIHCFDQKYYGTPSVDSANAQALQRDVEPMETNNGQRRRLGDYTSRTPSMHVGIVAADVAKGKLHVLGPEVPIVEALTAATALVPFFPAAKIADGNEPGWYIDGTNISRQAIGPLMDLLRKDLGRDRQADGRREVAVYSVSTLPISVGEMPCDDEDLRGVIRVALRAKELEQLRDGTLERRLTSLYTRAMADNGEVLVDVDNTSFVRATVHPIDLPEPPRLNEKVWLCEAGSELNEAMLDTIAAGCRATVEKIMPAHMLHVARSLPKWQVPSGAVVCSGALKSRLGDGTTLTFGENEQADTPGLSEVCQRCALYVNASLESSARLAKLRTCFEETAKNIKAQRHCPEEWPIATEYERRPSEVPMVRVEERPENRCPPNPFDEMPVKAMLFGGGVFRGVFHVGTLNAANELGLQPNLVAGSSVGSIVAAMVARVFSDDDRESRALRIGRLAASFLALDRFVMTDRLADFARRFTLRAAQTTFSPYDLDRVFRRFDAGDGNAFSRRVRRVAAGVERLLYVSPFELQRLAELHRDGRYRALREQLANALQEFFQRGGVGNEILGADALRTLIDLHVLRDPRGSVRDVRDILLDHFREIEFFVTATDLNKGKLVLLDSTNQSEKASLLFSLLASSAFPAVFRPRYSWEVYRRSNGNRQFIDGGVFDNLPLDTVAQYLDGVLRTEAERRPMVNVRGDYGVKTLVNVPHLLFTASLEPDVPPLRSGGEDLEQVRRNCRLLYGRAKTFGHNRKIDAYARVQRDLRRIHQASAGKRQKKSGPPLLDLEVVAVKPRWLCNTFGFHPMLGFKRWKQAASIAHGCAATFGTMMSHAARNEAWLKGWKLNVDDLDRSAITVVQTETELREPSHVTHDIQLRPQGSGKKEGTCWFRRTARCPFSRQALEELHWTREERDVSIRELEKIYIACGIPSNHQTASI